MKGPDTTTPQINNNAPKDRSTYGSGRRRAMRAVQAKGPEDSIEIPRWYLDRHVKLRDEEAALLPSTPIALSVPAKVEERTEMDPDLADIPIVHGSDTPVEVFKDSWIIDSTLFQELFLSVKARLMLPAAENAHELAAVKAQLLLQFPGDKMPESMGGTVFLSDIVRTLAHKFQADLIVLDCQDLAELAATVQDESVPSPDAEHDSVRLMSYDIYREMLGEYSYGRRDDDDIDNNESDDGSAEQDNSLFPSARLSSTPVFTKVIPITASYFQSLVRPSRTPGRISPGNSYDLAKNWLNPKPKDTKLERERTRWRLLAEALLRSPNAKERLSRGHGEAASISVTSTSAPTLTGQRVTPSTPLIVLVKDYRDIQNNKHGRKFILALQELARRRRREGQKIVIIGTESPWDSITYDFKDYLRNNRLDSAEDESVTIVVTPLKNSRNSHRLRNEGLLNTFIINHRHLRDMIRLRRPREIEGEDLPHSPQYFDNYLDKNFPERDLSYLRTTIWTYTQIHHLASLLLGRAGPEKAITWEDLHRCYNLLEASEEAKLSWKIEKTSQRKRESKKVDDVYTATREDRLKDLRKTCNTHEKKLLNGVVNADEIRTTFADVHAPEETVEALKTLTTLSLIRPDAFAYGVLATDKIPGLLLYGPPGTGKTLLAKAVAKESGATVLEVSGSELYDMYVGEGEKNVKAVFSLAKKLSPCVVFIDEADAIFNSRTTSSTRATHRELINQFLKEWDGMESLSAFIMVATNRPFDLDDAVLRRLPRRVLVDLPTEKDREAILRIHLKGEAVDPGVDIASCAARTPLYSGSDLKNLCVAAALACVREENILAAKYTAENKADAEPYKYPIKRTLTAAHFERAMDEISASISEDMSSLGQIKKFDEKFGDRKGRRKKAPRWGFQSADEADKGLETGRVRN